MTQSAVNKVLLFGGSFDPPHKGHLNLLQNAVAAVKPDLVLVVPSAAPPHKAASHTPWAVRADMCRCFAPVFDNLVISDLEVRRTGRSYTIDTVTAIKAEYPKAGVYLCVGGDMLNTFTTWHRWEELLRGVTLVAMPRHADEMRKMQSTAAILQSVGGCVLFAEGPVVEISSTEIRERVARGDANALEQVPPPADTIIREQGLYQTE